ncbi:MAG: hypothetical protein N3A38_09960 [Planctomycetota bacterium]|nr:hypothetical protein [Planctomycetota bacterium]
MIGHESRIVPLTCAAVAIAAATAAPALDSERLKVQRKEVFEFTEKPKVTREGIAMDKDDNIYLMATGWANHDGKPHPDVMSCALVKMKAKTKILSTGPIPLSDAEKPKRPPDLLAWRDAGNAWIEDIKWVFGDVGIDTQCRPGGHCHCLGNSRFTLDYFGRSFAPEIARSDVAVLDTAGNLILRVGRYGNVEDGMPLVKDGGPPDPRSIGGDEVALFSPRFVATDTDRRLFIADPGNARILSVRLGYHAEEKIALRDVRDAAAETK